MLSINEKNWHVTQKIDIGLKHLKSAQSIDFGRLSRTRYNHI